MCVHPLLGEGLEAILGGLTDVELVGPLTPEVEWQDQLPRDAPDVVFIAGDDRQMPDAAPLTTQILDRYPDVPVIRVGLEQNAVRLYTSRTLPARSADLIGVIRSLPVPRKGALPSESRTRGKQEEGSSSRSDSS